MGNENGFSFDEMDATSDGSVNMSFDMDSESVNPNPGAASTPATSVATRTELGRGLDVGTANLVSSVQDCDSNVHIKIQRNAFLDIDADDYTKNMLTRLNVQYVVINNRMVVVGDPAFELANIFNRETAGKR